ncbi:lipopolysaccharide-induced tumor necrosis factor-alpha factor homolog isoform X2 [Amblyomma americanum]
MAESPGSSTERARKESNPNPGRKGSYPWSERPTTSGSPPRPLAYSTTPVVQREDSEEAKREKRERLIAPDHGYTYTAPVPLNTCSSSPMMVFGQPGPVSIVTVFSSWGPHPVSVSCPYCRTFVTTQVCPQPGLLTWLMCSGMAMLGCVFGCCFVPFCVYECQDVEHFCPNCRRILGVFRRI